MAAMQAVTSIVAIDSPFTGQAITAVQASQVAPIIPAITDSPFTVVQPIIRVVITANLFTAIPVLT